MDNHDSAASVYSEAKGEYTKQLTLFIVPTFHRFFMSCLTQASQEEENQKRQLWKFQELLSQIPEWNVDKVQREVQKFISDIPCDYLEELVTAVFIAHTKVLTAIRIGNKNKRVQITIPKLDHFLHRSLSECSRLLWSSAFLFHNELSPIEKQKNHRQIEGLIHEGIGQAIRGLLPVKNILKDYLAEPEAEGEAEEDEEAEAKTDNADTVPEVKVEVPTESSEAAPAPEVVVAPEAAPAPEVVVAPEAAPAPEVAPAPAPAPAPEPKVPTLVIDSDSNVRFTNYDQVIQETGEVDYVEKTNSIEDSDAIEFADESREELTDFEVLTDFPDEPLNKNDFESL
jgi:outer membrane biosynthesis protein TonB